MLLEDKEESKADIQQSWEWMWIKPDKIKKTVFESTAITSQVFLLLY